MLAALTQSHLSHLDWLESEAIHIMREVAGQCSNPVLLFSGGKDSICMLRIAEKAFRPGRSPSRCCTSTPATTTGK
jgi:sulfate adenylyltransferase subunit 2